MKILKGGKSKKAKMQNTKTQDAQEMKQSIYYRIEKIIQEKGYVPEDFRLEETKEGKISFAPGALEGILGHHSSGKSENAEKVALFFKEHLHEEPAIITAAYEQEWAELGTATVRSGLVQYILKHSEEYEAGKLANLAYFMIMEGRKSETVKMGLVLMALFNMSENEQVRRVLITLGSCEEFTDYVLANISDWSEEEQNQICFELAKKLSGWGKINAVEQLQANTDEIREWILCEGCKNTILYAYLGLECAEKCNYLERLRAGELNERELQGAMDIMDGLLDEGPCAGISALKDGEETIYWYLCESEKKKADKNKIEYLCQLLDIKNYLEDEEDCADEDSFSEEYIDEEIFIDEGEETEVFADEGEETEVFADEGEETEVFADEGEETEVFAKEGDEAGCLADESNETDVFAKEGDEADSFDEECFDEDYFVEEYFERRTWRKKALQKLNEILDSMDKREMILQELKENASYALQAAKRLEIDVSEELYALMQEDFEKYYTYGYYLLKKEQMFEAYIELGEKHLDYGKLPVGMGNSMGFGKHEYWSVDMIVQYLDNYPGKGKELIRVSLNSPIVRWRNMAAKALEGWKEQTGQKLSGYVPQLYQEIVKVAALECDEKLRVRWNALLEESRESREEWEQK